MTSWTFSRVESVIRPEWLITLDAVLSETPASSATSRRVTRFLSGFGSGFGSGFDSPMFVSVIVEYAGKKFTSYGKPAILEFQNGGLRLCEIVVLRNQLREIMRNYARFTTSTPLRCTV